MYIGLPSRLYKCTKLFVDRCYIHAPHQQLDLPGQRRPYTVYSSYDSPHTLQQLHIATHISLQEGTRLPFLIHHQTRRKLIVIW